MLNTRGFTLFETIVSIALLPIVVLLVVQALFSEIETLMLARIDRTITDAASTILERLTQEIRLGESVVIGSSVLNANPGQLTLQSFTTPTSTVSATVTIALTGDTVTIERSGGSATTLSEERVRVTNLTFIHAINAQSELVQTTLTLEAGAGRFEKEKQFTTATVLRGSY